MAYRARRALPTLTPESEAEHDARHDRAATARWDAYLAGLP